MYELDPEIFGQQALRYNKNDPFGVNMRLKQSLSNTHKILFKQDNQRYIDNLQQIPVGPSRQMSAISIQESANDAFNPNLYKEESHLHTVYEE